MRYHYVARNSTQSRKISQPNNYYFSEGHLIINDSYPSTTSSGGAEKEPSLNFVWKEKTIVGYYAEKHIKNHELNLGDCIKNLGILCFEAKLLLKKVTTMITYQK